jgi:hypothetical protein
MMDENRSGATQISLLCSVRPSQFTNAPENKRKTIKICPFWIDFEAKNHPSSKHFVTSNLKHFTPQNYRREAGNDQESEGRIQSGVGDHRAESRRAV